MALIPIARPWTEQPQVPAQQDWSHPLSSELLVRVLGTDMAGGPAFPSIGSVGGISGAITGGSRHVSERGLAWSMAGGTDRVNLGASLALKPPSTTVCGWFRPASLTNAYSGLVSSATGTYRSLLLKSSGKLAIYANFGGAPLSYDGTGAYTLATGVWYHVAFTYNAATGALTGYVNAQVDATVGSTPADLPTNTSDTHIGDDPYSLTTRQFVGAWQNVRIYSRPLSQAELRALYENEYQDLEPLRIWVPVSAGGGGGNAIATPSGALTLTGFAPTVAATGNQTIAVPVGALALAGQTPTVAATANNIIAVPVGALSLAGNAPTVVATANNTVEVPVGALSLTGSAPAVVSGDSHVVQVPAGALSLSGLAPTVTATANNTIEVPAGALTLAGSAPFVAVSGSQTVSVPVGAMVLAGLAPTVVSTDHKIIGVPAGALALTGFAPTVTVASPFVIQVPAGALSLAGYAPTVRVSDEADNYLDGISLQSRITQQLPLSSRITKRLELRSPLKS